MRVEHDTSADVLEGGAVLDAVRYFVGAWTGESREVGHDGPLQLRRTLAPGVGGAWLAGRSEVEPLGVVTEEYWGRDGATRMLLRILVDNLGQHGILRSAGWSDDTLEWVGEVVVGGRGVLVRELILRVSEDEFCSAWEARSPAGEWVTTSVERCRRAQ